MEFLQEIPRTSEHWPLMTALAKGRQPASYLEIGCREGDSLKAVLAAGAPIQHVAICDTWGGEHGGTGRGSHAHIEPIVAEVPTVSWLDGYSRHMLPSLEDGEYDLILVDADHSYEGALYDLRESWRLLSKRGILAVHDALLFKTVADAVHTFLREVSPHAQCMSFTGDSGTAVIWRTAWRTK